MTSVIDMITAIFSTVLNPLISFFTKPKLSLYTDIRTGSKIGGPGRAQYECNIILGVRNAGRSSAKYVQLFLNTYPHKIDFIYGLDGNGNHGLPMLTSDNKLEGVTFTADANAVIHPNSHLEVTKIRFFIKDTDKKVKDATIEYKIYAESVKDVKNKKVIRGDEIIEKILPH